MSLSGIFWTTGYPYVYPITSLVVAIEGNPACSNIIALVTCVILNVALTPTMSYVGAAIATSAGLVTKNALSLIRVRTLLGIKLWL